MPLKELFRARHRFHRGQADLGIERSDAVDEDKGVASGKAARETAHLHLGLEDFDFRQRCRQDRNLA